MGVKTSSQYLGNLSPARLASRFLVGVKTISQYLGNINITFLATWGCANDFLCYQNLKLPPEINSEFFCGRKNSKIDVRNNSNFTITLPTIWISAGDDF